MGLSNAERQARWRAKRAELVEEATEIALDAEEVFDRYQHMAAWVIQLREEVRERNKKVRTPQELQELVGWIAWELGDMVPPAEKCHRCGRKHRPCDACGQEQIHRYVTPVRPSA
jgi:hypothetical protein